jgi:hypothetical protein
MEKYIIAGTQISFRVNNEERTELNQIAYDLQTENNIVFNNVKELTFAIIDKMKQGKAEAPRQEAEVVEVMPVLLQEKFAEIRASVFEGEELSELEMLDTLLSIINTPAPAVEIEKEVVKEVERPISENEVLVNVLPAQKDLVKHYKSGNKTSIKKIEVIFKELEIHPTTGTGQVEH